MEESEHAKEQDKIQRSPASIIVFLENIRYLKISLQSVPCPCARAVNECVCCGDEFAEVNRLFGNILDSGMKPTNPTQNY